MRRPTLAALLALSLAAPAAHATELYAYTGNTPVTGLIPLENMIDRKVDGVVGFNDYRFTPEYAIPNIGYGASLVPRGYKLAMSIGLAFGQPSKDPAHPGAHTLADVAAGRLDDVYAALGRSLVAHGFPAADIRLGWEENGTWYAWSAAHGHQADFRAAFTRVAGVLHATPGSRFTVWFNPGAGVAGSDQGKDNPHTGYDGVAWDVYATAWSGSWVEPSLWEASLKGGWGINTLGVWPDPKLPLAVPEFGVGSRGGDKHGAPDANNQHNGGDDGLFMKNALDYFVGHHARFVGYWDFNAGDYNSKISDGSRPHEALAFIQVMGPPRAVALLAGAKLAAARVATPAGMHSLLADLPAGGQALLLWGDDRKPRRFDLALPPSANSPATITALGAHGARALGRAEALRGFAYAGGLSVLKLTP